MSPPVSCHRHYKVVSDSVYGAWSWTAPLLVGPRRVSDFTRHGERRPPVEGLRVEAGNSLVCRGHLGQLFGRDHRADVVEAVGCPLFDEVHAALRTDLTVGQHHRTRRRTPLVLIRSERGGDGGLEGELPSEHASVDE